MMMMMLVLTAEIVARLVRVRHFALQPQEPRTIRFIRALMTRGAVSSPSSTGPRRVGADEPAVASQCVLPRGPSQRGGARGEAQDPAGPPGEPRHPTPGSIHRVRTRTSHVPTPSIAPRSPVWLGAFP